MALELFSAHPNGEISQEAEVIASEIHITLPWLFSDRFRVFFGVGGGIGLKLGRCKGGCPRWRVLGPRSVRPEVYRAGRLSLNIFLSGDVQCFVRVVGF